MIDDEHVLVQYRKCVLNGLLRFLNLVLGQCETLNLQWLVYHIYIFLTEKLLLFMIDIHWVESFAAAIARIV